MNSFYRIVPLFLLWAGDPADAMVALPAAATPDASTKARWEVDYGKTKCRLTRWSGGGEKASRLTIERDWTFGGYQWALTDPALTPHFSIKSVEVELGGEGDARRFKFASHAVTESGEPGLAWHDADGLVVGALRGGDRIRVTAARKLDVSMELANWGAAIKALEACENNMFSSWGLDAQQIRSLSVHAEPSNNAARWVTTDDYPKLDFARKNEGMTTFLVSVDARGAVTNCRIIDSSGFPSLDKRTCELLLMRSAFKPARDATGQAVASFYINRVRWQRPR